MKKIKLYFALFGLFLFLILNLGMNNSKNELLKLKEDFNYFNKYVKNEKITILIQFYCKIENIPETLAFSTAKCESNFSQYVWHENFDEEGNFLSIDRGVFQLNSRSYSNLSREQFYDLETNIKLGIKHLKMGLEKSGNFKGALAIYNGGEWSYKNNSVKVITLKYVERVLINKHNFDCRI